MFKIAFLIFFPSLGTHISVYLIGNVSVYFVREPVTQKNEDYARSMHYKSPSSSNIRRLLNVIVPIMTFKSPASAFAIKRSKAPM